MPTPPRFGVKSIGLLAAVVGVAWPCLREHVHYVDIIQLAKVVSFDALLTKDPHGE